MTTIRRRALTSHPAPPKLSLEPSSTYEAITRQMVERLEEDLSGIKSRLDSLLFVVIGSVLVDMLTRWITP